MKKILSLLLSLILFVGVAYYFYDDYKHKIDLPPFIESFLSTVSQDQQAYELSLNTNLSSDMALIAKAENNEGYAVFTKTIGGTETIDKIALLDAAGESSLLEVNDLGLPTKYTSVYGTVDFSNYTDTTVDINITRADGTIESLPASELNLPKQKSLSLVTVAYAAGLGVEATPGVTRADEVSFMEYITSSAGTALNIITCGVTLGSAVYTGGATSPFAYLKCAPLAVRLTTNYIDVFSCEQDVIDCATQAILSSFDQKGPTIGGVITSRADKQPLQGANIVIKDKVGRTKARATSGQYGHYTLPSIDLGGYTLSVSHEQGDAEFIVATTGDRIQISGESEQALDENYTNERQGFSKVADYFGAEVNQLFNIRFDVSLGEPSKFDGTWNGTADSSQAVVGDTECASATFTWYIQDNGIEGSALVDQDYSVKLTGGVEDSGIINAGSGLSLIEQVTFEGTLTESSGSGTWKGTSGCSGSWSASKEVGTPGTINEIQPIF